MSNPTRYDLRVTEDGAGLYATDEPNTRGMQYVSALDYEALRAERDELINAVEAFVHDDRVPNEVSQEFAEVLILSRRAALQGEQPCT